MDKLKLRYLIREAIENVVNVSSKFSVGDKVTTVDGDTAQVTMAEHPFYTVELEETGTTKSFNFKDLAPFQEKEISKTSEGIILQEGINASPGLMFHQQHNKPLSECVFRIGSKAYIDFYSEARELFNEGVLKINENDKVWIRTDIGEYGIFEGEKVPLDIPFINEDYKFMDLINIKNKLKDKGFKVKVGYPSDIDPRFPVQIDDENERNLDGLNAELTKMFGRDGYVLFADTNQRMFEAEFKGKNVKLNSPKRGGPKKFYVYVKNPKTGRIKKVTYGGTTGLKAKINNPKARKAFSARHNCPQKKDRTKASYWSCNLPRYAKQLGLGANKNTFW